MTDEFLDLLPQHEFTFGDPCFGRGALSTTIQYRTHRRAVLGHASELFIERWMSESLAKYNNIKKLDAKTLTQADLAGPIDMWIVNAPWRRGHLFVILENLISIAPCWMILPATFTGSRNSAPYMKRCTDVLPTGPLNWNGHHGRQHFSWFRFDFYDAKTRLHHRYPNGKRERKTLLHQ